MKNFASFLPYSGRLAIGAMICLAAGAVYSQNLKTQPADSNIPKTEPSGTNSFAPETSPRAPKARFAHPTEIKTVDGKTYTGLSVLRVEPDGLVAEYRPASGGMGITKIKFKDMPANLQQQYNYDPAKASAYEIGRAKGIAAWRAQQEKDVERAKAAAAQRAREDALEKREQAELAERKAHEPPPMTEEEKKKAQKEIEATWSGMKAAVKAGRITN